MNARNILAGLLLTLGLNALAASPPDYGQLKADAEKQFADGSYARAHDAYEQARALDLPAADARWVDFRLADTLWRSQAATQTADNTQLENAQRALTGLIRDINRVEGHDRVWAEVEESLGDYYWTRRNSQNWGEAWPHYQAALDWWAGTPDVELARTRYLKMVWTAARPPGTQPQYYYFGMYGNNLPLETLENALKIAQSDDDQAHAHYLVAMTLRNQGGDWDRLQRVPLEFEAAIKPGKKTEWFDDALFNYAQWMENSGHVIALPNGTWTQEQDYVRALELYRQFVKEFAEGESRYWPQAQQEIKNITAPVVGVSVANVFLPDSEIQYNLNWRNVKHMDLALYAVDLTKDVKINPQGQPASSWLQTIDLAGREKVKSWSRETDDKGIYKPGNATARYEGKLPVGAYMLEVKGEGQVARDLLLVSDATVVVKASGEQALVYLCNALDGSPRAAGDVHLWESWNDRGVWYSRDAVKQTGDDGIAVFDLKQSVNNEQIFVGATVKDRQAFGQLNNYFYNRNQEDRNWKIYATTDRPAYRPKETVQWKFTARKYDGKIYSTPDDTVIEYEIHDPRGAKVKEDKVTLNAFGSAWGSLDLTETMPLGEYQVIFWNQGKGSRIGQATLFRLEEYKLPEFKVTVAMPEENGHKKAFRLGETVSVNVQADYYFGGSVSNADVEVIVYQNPLYQTSHRPHEYPWYYEDMTPEYQQRRYYGGGQGQIIKRETLKTDAAGKAALSFDTPANGGQDFEYRVEARVTDSSRREIVGNGTARVTRQRYAVYPEANHNIYRPQDKVTVDFKAQDANEQPVQTEGIVRVTRERWYEIWLDPSGREVQGEELRQLQARGGSFPPLPARPNDPTWQLKFRGYEHDDILTRTLKTDTNGEAELTFTPERDGYYRVAWSSEDNGGTNARPSAPITAETTVWVATTASTELGYRHGGMEIIVDKDTFRAGQTAPVMLSVPTSDRYVLFTAEARNLISYQLVHVTGMVKLIELPIEEKHVPNIFLGASLVSDRQLFEDTKQVIVPPTKNFLTVDVKSDREQYRPREEGTFTITTLDDQKKPVAAEVSFGLADEAVYYIQSDYAGDPRQFYFGTKRPHEIQNQSTFNQKSYAKLVAWDTNGLIDERDLEQRRRQSMNRKDEGYDRDGALLDEMESVNGPVRARRLALIGGARGGIGGGGGYGLADSSESGALLGMNAAPAAAPVSFASKLRADVIDQSQFLGSFPVSEPAVQVRSDFRSTILWKPDVITGKDGKATLKVKYPDSLTGWLATARAVTTDNSFGIAITNTHTKQPLIVRLEAPRFFLVGDQVTISAVVNNNTDKELRVGCTLNLVRAKGLNVQNGNANKTGVYGESITVPANGEARVDWVATVTQPGEATLSVSASADKLADAMENTYTIYEHGLEKFISKSGKVRGDDVTVKLDLPKERREGSTTLTVQVTPSMAVTMLDALPYLVGYPYGSTENSMSRFLPAVVTAKTLKDLGIAPEDAMTRVFGGIETNTAAATHPAGKQDLQKLDALERTCLDRLYDFQHSDGGWSWWKDGESDHWMTAYVVWGLALARDAGVTVKDDVLRRGTAYLDKKLVEEEINYDMQAWMLHALSVDYALAKRVGASPGGTDFQRKAFENLWTNRDKLNAYTRALLTLSAHDYGYDDRAKTLVENLENGVKLDNAPDTSVVMQGAQQTSGAVIGTAHWGEDGIYWRWSEGGVEATAFALRAMMAVDPTNKLVEPVCNWLIKNRRGAQWNNTRDTSITVLAMNDYLRASGELSPDLEYELSVNGHPVASKKVTGADIFNAPSQFAIDAKWIKDGENAVRIVRKSGKGAIYFAANAMFFSQEEPVTAAGNEIFVRRQYYKLEGRQTLLKGLVYDRVPLNDGDSVKSGERIETLVTIEAKNDYEYLVFEDLKPAGFEAVEIRSGTPLRANELKSGALDRKLAEPAKTGPASTERVVREGDSLSKIAREAGSTIGAIQKANNLSSTQIKVGQKLVVPGARLPVPGSDGDYTGRSQGVYEELRDRKAALFIDKLPEGVWEIHYDYRAEVPGEFHALPVVGRAMYVPEIRCNGQEVRIKVLEGKE